MEEGEGSESLQNGANHLQGHTILQSRITQPTLCLRENLRSQVDLPMIHQTEKVPTVAIKFFFFFCFKNAFF
jgi:hypothetical protein